MYIFVPVRKGRVRLEDYTNKNPRFTNIVKIIEKTDPVNADIPNTSTKQLLDNDLCLKNAINKCEKTAVLKSGQTSITFSFEDGSIGENSKISLEASMPDINYESITVKGDNVTAVFEAQTKDIYVKAVVTDELV